MTDTTPPSSPSSPLTSEAVTHGVEGWRGRWDWQQGGWDFDWSITSIDGFTAVITGIGHYVELGDFDNVWTLHFDESGLCTRFDMLNTKRN